VRRGLLTLIGLTGALLLAHEGHDEAVRPVYKEVQVGGTLYRAGFAVIPQDPVVGEDARLEFRILHAPTQEGGASTERPASLDSTRVEIVPTDGDVVVPARIVPGDKPGTYLARHRFSDAGQYGISTRVQSGSDTVTAEFPVLVRAGPVARAPLILDAVLLLIFGGAAFSVWRLRQDPERGSSTGPAAAIAAAGAVILVASHVWAGPRIGRMFLPERHGAVVVWEDAAQAAPAPGVAPHVDPPGTPPHTHPPAPPRGRGDAPQPPSGQVLPEPTEIASTVVAVPGQQVDVVVPVTSRVLFEDFVPRLGRSVRKGQTIAVLEHHYIVHDANHLNNQRWPFLVAALSTRRATVDLELKAARLRRAQETADAAVRQMMAVTQTVSEVEGELAQARLAQQQAEKALAMHDAQLAKTNLVKRPLTSPLDGTIEEVHFTQGQMKYENDKLLTILDLSRVWIEARFPESAAVRPPRQMTFVSPAFPDVRFEGRLARVADTMDPATRTVSAFFEVANPNRLLRIGMRLAGRRAGDGPPARLTATSGRGEAVRAADPLGAPALTLAATVRAQPERTAEVTAPLWGRIEFAGRRLNVGDRVRKGEDLVKVILELSVDERYPMEARAVEIEAERKLADARLAQAAKQYQEAVALLKANPSDPFLKEQVQLTERRHHGAEAETVLLARQAEAFDGVMKRRDPRITIVQAPISGVITDVGFRLGELNRTGEFRRLFTIVDPSRVWLEAQVYENQSAAVVRGVARASFTSPGLPSPRLLDRPIAVSGSIKPDAGTLSVIFDVPNPDGALKVGASAQIVIPRN
jgi:multidrug efflux pump subunit AcrA (membrane-fusion protein)